MTLDSQHKARRGANSDGPMLRAVTSIPALGYLLVFMAIPLLLIISYAFLTAGRFGGVKPPLTFENITRLIQPIYRDVLFTSVLTAGAATLLAFALGFPAALVISRLTPRWQTIALIAVVLPFWTNFLIRTYAWIIMLNSEGPLNALLMATHVTGAPIPFLYNRGAVVVGLLYAYLPLMILTLYASIERLDPQLREAAANLGATPSRVFRDVTLPLTLPAVITGSLFVFVPSLGNFVVPELLGGGKTVMVGNVIRDQFLKARDWPFGATLGLLVIVFLVLLFVLQSWASRRVTGGGRGV